MRSAMRRLGLLAVFLTTVVIYLCGAVSTAVAQEPRNSDEQKVRLQPTASDGPAKAISFLLEEMRFARYEFKSGRAEFTGHMTSRVRGQPEHDLDGPIQGAVAIDSGRTRYDITRPGWVVDPSTIKAQELQPQDASQNERLSITAQSVKGVIRKKFAYDGSLVTCWDSNQSQVSVGDATGFTDWRYYDYVDIRCPILFGPLAITRGWSLARIFENFDTGFDECAAELDRTGDPLWKITWTYVSPAGNDTVRWVLVVDVSKQFVPVSYTCESLQNNTWTKEWENTSSWVEVNGVMVVASLETNIFQQQNSPTAERLRYEYNWKNVNEPVPADTFTYETFDLPRDMPVQDEDHWIKPPAHHLDAAVSAVELQPSPNRNWFIVANVAVVATLFLLVCWRYAKGRRCVS